MKQYSVEERSVTISSGILLLSNDQAEARTTHLENLGDGLYQVNQPVQFKRGEIFGYDGDVNKDILQQIKVVKETKVGRRNNA